jgi:hypothetical protein
MQSHTLPPYNRIMTIAFCLKWAIVGGGVEIEEFYCESQGIGFLVALGENEQGIVRWLWYICNVRVTVLVKELLRIS